MRKDNIKYNSLSEILEAQLRGELTEPLIIYNDNSFIYNDDGECVYRGGGPETLAEELLDLIGIKWDWC